MKTTRNKNWIWGILLLLAAGGLIANQFGLFRPLDFWTIVAAVLGLIFLGSAITNKTLSTVPFIIAMAYLVLRNQGVLPFVALWVVLAAAALSSVGIGLIFPQKIPQGSRFVVGSFTSYDEDDYDGEVDSEEGREERRRRAQATGIDNNPAVSVNFGSASRYLHADKLETVSLSCNFGGMEIYFDQAQLHPSGANVYLDCKFGGIDIYVPRHWRVNEQVNCTIGAVDIDSRKATPTENAPELTITGNILCGGVDIWYV